MFHTVRAGNGVVFLRSDKLVSTHGFATRIGGVSCEAHTASLNLAFGRGDGEDTVLENLSLFADAVGFDKESIISLPQIHSADVLTVDESHRGQGYFRASLGEVDGYATSDGDITLGVKSADCVPILLEAEDKNGNIMAVAAIHAGWRGTVGGIAENAVRRLLLMGATADKIRAAIGPAIGDCCFEVGEEFYQTVADARGTELADRFVFVRGQKTFADIKGMNQRILTDCGVSAENIDLCSECTCCLLDKYFSHRRMSGLRGTMLSIINMKNQLGNSHKFA